MSSRLGAWSSTTRIFPGIGSCPLLQECTNVAAAIITVLTCKTLILNEVSPRNPAIQRGFRAKKNDTVKQMTLSHQISTSGHVAMRGDRKKSSLAIVVCVNSRLRATLICALQQITEGLIRSTGGFDHGFAPFKTFLHLHLSSSCLVCTSRTGIWLAQLRGSRRLFDSCCP